MARFLLLLTLASSTALAAPTLFPESLPARSALTLLPQVEADQPPVRILLATGAAAALFATPAALMLGSWAGTWSNNLYAALVPALLIALLLPPLAVVLSEWRHSDRFRWGPALAVALVTQLLLVAGAVLIGLSGVSAAGVGLFTLADVIALPAVTTAMLRWTERPAPTVPLVSGTF